MSKYKHILFDIDGTLIDTFEANMVGLIELLDQYIPGHDWTMQRLALIYGIPGNECMKVLGIPAEHTQEAAQKWVDKVQERCHLFKVYDGILPVLSFLKKQGYHMTMITSRTRGVSMGGPLGTHSPEPIRPFISDTICCDDTARPKPFPDPIDYYREKTGAKREEILFIGDTHTDLECAQAAGVDFALALWGYQGQAYLKCTHYLRTPWDLVSILSQKDTEYSLASQMHRWAREINAIGQNGLTYVKDRFDKERYERLQDIAAEMAHYYIDEQTKIIKKQWCTEGYKTPQIDTRAAIFNDEGKILMVKEKLSGKWNLPGGWCDEDQSLVSNVVKEVWEEACMEVYATRLIAIHDRSKHNTIDTLTGCLKAFIECKAGPGTFVDNIETAERRFFAKDELPVSELRTTTCTLEQILMCFACHEDPNWQTVVE